MAREDDDLQEVPRVTRATRRDQPSTDRLSRGAVESDTLNPNWRSDRAGGRARASRSMPFSRQEFALWLQYGGWRFILAAVAILVVGGALYILSQPGPTPLPQTIEEPAAEEPLAPTLPSFATVTPSALTPIPATAAPAGLSGQQLRVTGTEGLGLFLRAEPTTANQPLKTLAENSVVTVLGEPTTAEGITWLRVRDETGAEGWAAQEFLQPAQ
jgi:hypothetical protein